MSINIRKHIINNFKESPISEIEDSIDSSIKSKDEVILPGLGVLFEILWKNSDNNQKSTILDTLKENL